MVIVTASGRREVLALQVFQTNPYLTTRSRTNRSLRSMMFRANVAMNDALCWAAPWPGNLKSNTDRLISSCSAIGVAAAYPIDEFGSDVVLESPHRVVNGPTVW